MKRAQRNKNTRQLSQPSRNCCIMFTYYVILKECGHRSYNIKNDNIEDKIIHHCYCDQCQQVRTIKTLGFILENNMSH